MAYPPLPPGWIYKPKEAGSVLPRLLGATQIDDMPLVVVDGDADVRPEIFKESSKLGLHFYEHLILRLDATVVDGQKTWPFVDVFISSHIPGKERPQEMMVTRTRFDPPLSPDDADLPDAIRAFIDGPHFAHALALIQKNLRLTPYFGKHVKTLPKV